MHNPDFSKPHYLIDTFTRHRLASNLLMIMLALAGLWGIRQLTVQLNPAQDANEASVSIAWPGASAEDIERLVTEPVEQQLRSLTRLASLALNSSATAPPRQTMPSNQPSPDSRRPGQRLASRAAMKGALSSAKAGVPGVT